MSHRAFVGKRYRLSHDSGLASLLWVVNLGCIDLNQWYARCDDVDRPDYVHFDLDPVPGASFEKVIETALLLREALESSEDAVLCEDDGLEGNSYLRSDRTWPNAKAGLGFCEGAFARFGGPGAETDYRDLHGGEAAEGQGIG